MAESLSSPTFDVPEEFFILKGPCKAENNFLYVCQKCPKGVEISCNVKSRQNLKTHVKSKHGKSNYERFLSLLSDKRQKKPEKDDDIAVVTQEPKQVTLSTMWGRGKLTQKDLDKAIVQYLMNAVLPFNHVESQAFREFVQKLSGNQNLEIKGRMTVAKQTMSNLKELKESYVMSFKVCKAITTES